MNLSVLIPIHNESQGIDPIYQRTRQTMETLPGLSSWQIVFLNNASDDDSLERVLALRKQDPRVKVITLSRNFGYQGSLLAGVSTIESDLYAIVDGDGEDPPELLSEFYGHIQNGAQIVYGIRSKREEPRFITAFRGLFYYVNRWIADSSTVLWMAEYAMFTRQVRDSLSSKSTYPFLRTELAYVGFRRVGVPYTRAQRKYGKTHFNPYQMVKFAVSGFLSSSTFPLRLILYVAALLAVGFPIIAWLADLSDEETVHLSVLLLFYFMLLSISMIALYLARTYKNTMAWPLFVIDKNSTHLS